MEAPGTDGAALLRQDVLRLRALREQCKSANRRPRRDRLSSAERDEILAKTDARCHICGGEITSKWNADHVFAHSAGGRHSIDNYLPAHGTCNNYRWDYLPDEFELILKLGVWARTQIEKNTPDGRRISEKFAKHEVRRVARRRESTTDDSA
jgi:hypothetical protein